MATVGRNKAVVQTSNFHLSGSLAWVMWMVVRPDFTYGHAQ